MATFKAPFVGSFNTRDFNASASLDQKFTNCVFKRAVNPAANAATWYTEKRAGLDSLVAITSGAGTGIFSSPSLATITGFSQTFTPAYIMSFGSLPSTVWFQSSATGAVNCGTPGGSCGAFIEEILSGITYIIFNGGNADGWFLPSDSMTNLAYTGDGNNSITISDLKVAGVSSVQGLYVGQKLAAASNIVSGSRIATINAGAFSLTLDTATTGGAFNDLAITKTPIAKIVDTDFPAIMYGANLHSFAEMDGFVFAVTDDRKIYNSDLNSITSWTAGNFIQGTITTAPATGIFKHRNKIVLFKKDGIEFFYNAGNAAGSPLSSDPQLASNIGAPYAAAITKAGDTIYWIGPDRCLWRLNGFSPEKIVAEGNILGGTTNSGPNISFRHLEACYINGLLAIHVNSSGSDRSYDRMYFPELNIWANQNFTDQIYLGGEFGTPVVVTAKTANNGNAFQWGGATTAVFQDNAVAYTMTVQVATDMGTNFVKRVREIRVEADNQSTGNLAVSYSDDDGATFSTPRNISMATQRKRLTRLGKFEGSRLWKFEHSDNTACRLKSFEIDYETGTR